ncbi:MAG TPA: hypothetical protein ENH28_00940 [Euryarchaeota archaeon]|nr:hypothetical protein [Euryarchaeota archaeon]
MQKNLSEIAVDVLLETGVYISAKVATVEEYEQMKNFNTGFYQNIARESVTIELNRNAYRRSRVQAEGCEDSI